MCWARLHLPFSRSRVSGPEVFFRRARPALPDLSAESAVSFSQSSPRAQLIVHCNQHHDTAVDLSASVSGLWDALARARYSGRASSTMAPARCFATTTDVSPKIWMRCVDARQATADRRMVSQCATYGELSSWTLGQRRMR